MAVFFYDLAMSIGDALIISLIPLCVGLFIKKPIRLWICILVAALIFGVYAFIPMSIKTISVHETSIYGGILASIASFVFLYFLSRRKRKQKSDKPQNMSMEASVSESITADNKSSKSDGIHIHLKWAHLIYSGIIIIIVAAAIITCISVSEASFSAGVEIGIKGNPDYKKGIYTASDVRSAFESGFDSGYKAGSKK